MLKEGLREREVLLGAAERSELFGIVGSAGSKLPLFRRVLPLLLSAWGAA